MGDFTTKTQRFHKGITKESINFHILLFVSTLCILCVFVVNGLAKSLEFPINLSTDSTAIG